ncbi:Rrf2 family transcriptional regulator [Andreprevotia chitinilytica]|uniref:Rrf2 family transcriptional regulator n=1 Tax=Andreprevotia chitinilytica TaxID=396808 RepID=UPI00054DA032|nr:Rrf2 family transcriptional regulator [Andreprevotia chitinilytica]
MNTSSRFAVGVHILALLATSTGPVPSAYIAGSVNTNPVLIRRILGLLGQAGLTWAERGVKGGTQLAKPPAEIKLIDIYHCVEEPGVLGLHRNMPNPACEIGRNITGVLSGVFDQAQAAMEGVLAALTLQDMLDQLGSIEKKPEK